GEGTASSGGLIAGGGAGAGLFSTSALLQTRSVGGQALSSANTVGSFNATNTSSGAISLVNTATTLTVTGITQSGTAAGSNVSVRSEERRGANETGSTGPTKQQTSGKERRGAETTATAGPANVSVAAGSTMN